MCPLVSYRLGWHGALSLFYNVLSVLAQVPIVKSTKCGGCEERGHISSFIIILRESSTAQEKKIDFLQATKTCQLGYILWPDFPDNTLFLKLCLKLMSLIISQPDVSQAQI